MCLYLGRYLDWNISPSCKCLAVARPFPLHLCNFLLFLKLILVTFTVLQITTLLIAKIATFNGGFVLGRAGWGEFNLKGMSHTAGSIKRTGGNE